MFRVSVSGHIAASICHGEREKIAFIQGSERMDLRYGSEASPELPDILEAPAKSVKLCFVRGIHGTNMFISKSKDHEVSGIRY